MLFSFSVSTLVWGCAAVVAVMTWGVLVSLDRRRYQGASGTRRMLALAVATGSLWFLLAGPTWERDVALSEALLVTPGWTEDQLERRQHEAASLLLAIGPGAPDGATVVPDLGFVSRHFPGIQRLDVYGHGLPEFEWSRTAADVRWAGPAAQAAGIREIHWPREIALGDSWQVRGHWTGVADGSVQLRGPGGIAAQHDWAAADGASDGAWFTLQLTPPRVGRQRYTLEVLGADGSRLTTETLDLTVREPQAVRVLWLEGSPQFETRHFKRWLTEQGDALVVRSTISRDRTRIERHNHPAIDVSRLTPGLLERFDLVVLEPRVLAGMRSRERRALLTAIHGGLGALVLGHDPGESARDETAVLAGWPVRAIADLDSFSARPLFANGRRATALEVEPFEIEPTAGLAPLLQDRSGTLLAASRNHGAGAVGMTLVRDSFRWVLEGNATDHASYWSQLISRLARRHPDPRWLIGNGVVLVDEPLRVFLEAPAEESVPTCTVVHVADGDTRQPLAPRQDPLDPNRWEITLFPRQTGWHTLESAGGTTAFYAQPRTAWTTWQQARSHLATAATEARPRPPGTSGAGHDTRRVRTGIPPWLLFGSFLTSLAFLWADERF